MNKHLLYIVISIAQLPLQAMTQLAMAQLAMAQLAMAQPAMAQLAMAQPASRDIAEASYDAPATHIVSVSPASLSLYTETEEKTGDRFSLRKPIPYRQLRLLMLTDIQPVRPFYHNTDFRSAIIEQEVRGLSEVNIGFQYHATPWRTNIPQLNFRIAMNGSEYARQFTRGATIYIGVEIALLAVMTTLPKSFTKWEDGYMEAAMHNLGRAYHEPPKWDEDDWVINYAGHPYAGSMFYNTVRSQGASIFESFVFSAFLSTFWEYVIEAVAEQPSAQDLFVTPVAGTALGELFHVMTMSMKKNGTTFLEKVAITILNPAHAIMEGYD